MEGRPASQEIEMSKRQLNLKDNRNLASAENCEGYKDGRTWKRGTMVSVFRVYTEDTDKNSGCTTENFERKFGLFMERCDQADSPDEDRHRAFSILLARHARRYCFDIIKSKKISSKTLEKAMKIQLLSPERPRLLLRE